MLQNLTDVNPMDIPLNDSKVMELFNGLKSLNIKPEDIAGETIGTIGVPEFGTKFVREMLSDTKPQTFADLVRVSGLSHGTDV
jgi:DNA polymerase-3 subunit alpha (Gram-positive type)